MNCTEAQSLVAPFLEKKLNLEQGMRLARHIQGCAQCREELEFYLVVYVTTGVIEDDDWMGGDYSKAAGELLEEALIAWQRSQRLARVRRVRLVMVLLFVGIALGVSMSRTTAEVLPSLSAVVPSFYLEGLELPEEISFVQRAISENSRKLLDFTLSRQERMLLRTRLWERDGRILAALKPGGEIRCALPEEFGLVLGSFEERLLAGRAPELKRSAYITLKKQ